PGGGPVARVRWFVGVHPRSGVRAGARRPRARAGPARDLPVPPVGDRLVLPGRRLPPLPRRLGGLPGTAAPRRRRRGGPLRRLRPRGRLPPPAALWRARDRTRRRAGVDHV